MDTSISILFRRVIQEINEKFANGTQNTQMESDECSEKDDQPKSDVFTKVCENPRQQSPQSCENTTFRESSHRSPEDSFSLSRTSHDQTIIEVLDTSRNSQSESPDNKDKKLNCIINELILTEDQFQIVLTRVINDYKPYIEKKFLEKQEEEVSNLFGNIQEVLQKSSHFLSILKQSPDVGGVVKAFASSDMFESYRKYVRNKQKQDRAFSIFLDTIREHQQTLGDVLGLSSHLLTPLQRPGRYILLLENILKELKHCIDERYNSIKYVLNVAKKEMRLTNDYLAIDSIKNCLFDLRGEGTFILKEKFEMIKPLQLVVTLFLFENSVIFTFPDQDNIEQFMYLTSIKIDSLNIVSFKENSTNIFQLIDHEKVKRRIGEQHTYTLKADKPQTKFLFVEIIEKALWDQFSKLKEKQKSIQSTYHDLSGKKKLSVAAVRYLKEQRSNLSVNQYPTQAMEQ